MAVNLQDTNASVVQAITSGPIAPLYGNKYEYFNLQYPRDIETTSKGHSVHFSIYEVNPVSIDEFGTMISDAAKSAGTYLSETFNPKNAVDNTDKLLQGVTTAGNDFIGFLKEQKNKLKAIGPITQRTNTSASGFIKLYMPETLDFNYAAQYGELSLSTAIGSLPGIGSIANAITSYISPGGTGAAARLGLNYAGYVFNPQEQLLFEGIQFREYTMSFTFTPFSSQEAQTVKNIIQKFREHAAPEIVTEAAGFFFNPPSFFDITFLNNGQINPNINKLKRSVLQNVDVNYAPNGWSAHEDGMPVQTTMTLQFKEIELVDRKAVREGY